MSGAKEAIAFVQIEVKRLRSELSKSEELAEVLNQQLSDVYEEIAETESEISRLQGLITDWRTRYKAELDTLPREIDPVLKALAKQPVRHALEHLAEQNAGLVNVQEAIRTLDEAGYLLGDGAVVRTALTAGRKRGDWRSLGKGQWERIHSNGHHAVQAQQATLPEAVISACWGCRRKHEMTNPVEFKAKNGRRMLRSVCEKTGRTMTRFAPGKDKPRPN